MTSFDPVMDDLKDAAAPGEYLVRGDTAVVSCSLRPSGFSIRIPKKAEERDEWTARQRWKADLKNLKVRAKPNLGTAKELLAHVSRFPGYLTSFLPP
jgi:hypothetical protein